MPRERKRNKDDEASAAADEGKEEAVGEETLEEEKQERKEVRTAAEVAAERAAEAVKASADEAPETEQPEAEPEPAEPEEVPTAEPTEATLPPVTVPDLLTSFCAMLIGQGWQKLGLVVDPATGDIAQDLEQARLAIDSLAALADQLGEHLTDEEKRELDAALANLRLNYVQRVPSGPTEPGEGNEADN